MNCRKCWRGLGLLWDEAFGAQDEPPTTIPAITSALQEKIPSDAPPETLGQQVALLNSIASKDSGLLNSLLVEGAKPNEIDLVTGCSPLTLACSKRNSEAVIILLAAGARAEMPDGNGETPLVAAVKSGAAEVVAALIGGGGADPVKRVEGGLTALQVAAEKGDHEIFSQLLASATVYHSRTASRIDFSFVN